QLGQPSLGHFVTFAAERREHVRRELVAVYQRLENGLLQRLNGAIFLVIAELAPERVLRWPAGEARLQEEIRELLQEGLEVDRVGQLGAEPRVGVCAHGAGLGVGCEQVRYRLQSMR